ncbi:hypothetical protein FOWG_06627 [Fusarium oxysporum f. sp. lycopersici MN25]|nr:hypothetical protein FOWG_06627 [Fusarium oxysporum f. sp. lycopersici MN25]
MASRAVSCQFCRQRKLRCNRQFPCSNCLSRGVPCPSLQPPTRHLPEAGAASNDAILSRLDKIEAHLAALTNSSASKNPLSGEEPRVVLKADVDPEFHRQLSPMIQELTEDAFSIDRSLFKNDGATPTHNILVRKCPIAMQPPPGAQPKDYAACIWFPTIEEAQSLVNKYIVELNYMSYIVHGPTLRKLVTEAYDGGPHISASLAVLLLAIFAFVARTWTHVDAELAGLFYCRAQAQAQASSWTTTAFDVLEQCHRNSEVSLELAQGLSILNSAIFHFEGLTSRGSTVLAQTIAMCRQLGLHRIDHPGDRTSLQDNPSLYGVRAEVGRRVWWRLATLDWMLAAYPGPQKGTYFISSLHMAVRKPLNLEDENLTDASELLGQGLTKPTSMFYFLERIRLAEKIKSAIDKSPLTGVSTYGQVLEVDAAIASTIQDTPQPLALKGGSGPSYSSSQNMEYIAGQCYSLHLLLHGQRCRLHLPYLIRGISETPYDQSREIALKSARFIIDGEVSLGKFSREASSSHFMLGGVFFSFFSAVAVLALDLCLAEPEEIKVKQQEFEQAWRILGEVPDKVSMIEEGMHILEVTMRKHHVWPLTETGLYPGSAETQQPHTEIRGHVPTADPSSTLQQD